MIFTGSCKSSSSLSLRDFSIAGSGSITTAWEQFLLDSMAYEDLKEERRMYNSGGYTRIELLHISSLIDDEQYWTEMSYYKNS